MKFDFSKSNYSDLQNKITLSKFDIMNKNILYLTHEVDKLNKTVTHIRLALDMQKQVDEFYETSPQTDVEEQKPE